MEDTSLNEEKTDIEDIDYFSDENASTDKDSKKKTRKKDNKEKDENVSIKKDLIETGIYILISLIIVLCVRRFLLQHVMVDGPSMQPTLINREHLFVEKVSYKCHDVERDDIIVFNPRCEKDDVYYVKRVIGLPNETIWIDENSKIHVKKDNSDKEEILEDKYGSGETAMIEYGKKVHIGENEFFVLGDNRECSKDSRAHDVGLVSKDSIMGKAWCVIWPFDRFGSVDKK